MAVFRVERNTGYSKDVRGYERKREYLPLSKMPEKPEVMGYTGI